MLSGEAQFHVLADGIADLRRISNEALAGGKKSVRFKARGVQVKARQIIPYMSAAGSRLTLQPCKVPQLHQKIYIDYL